MYAKKRSYPKNRKTASRFRKSNRYRNRRIGMRRSYGSRYSTVNHSKSLIAPRFFTKLEYSEELNALGGLSPTIGYTQFASNGLFDPYLALGGHQPMGFDQLQPLYIKYRVHAVKVRIQAISQPLAGQSATFGLIVGQYRDSSTTPANLSQADEDKQYYVMYVNDQKMSTFTKTFYPRTALGMTKRDYMQDDNVVGTFSANPASTTCLNVGVVEVFPTPAPPDTVMVKVHLTYYCEFFQTRAVGQS